MKSPEQRKSESEIRLHKRGIRINVQLPLIESDDEVVLRSVDDVFHRLIALWLVAGMSESADPEQRREYIMRHNIQSWLSNRERQLLFANRPVQALDQISDDREGLFFLAWCAGLIKNIEIPSHQSSLRSVLALFPQSLDEAPDLRQAIRIRPKGDIISWADLLFRLHWSVRHARLTGRPTPGNLNEIVVREWHRAVNWIIRYEDEDDWDLVGTDT